MTYLLDTHAWLWWNYAPEKLSRRVHKILRDHRGEPQLGLSMISVWEFFKLLERGRLKIGIDSRQWVDAALANLPVQLLPITIDVAHESTMLPESFHQDPADQILVATARLNDCTILTKDRRILDYAHVNSLW